MGKVTGNWDYQYVEMSSKSKYLEKYMSLLPTSFVMAEGLALSTSLKWVGNELIYPI